MDTCRQGGSGCWFENGGVHLSDDCGYRRKGVRVNVCNKSDLCVFVWEALDRIAYNWYKLNEVLHNTRIPYNVIFLRKTANVTQPTNLQEIVSI